MSVLSPRPNGEHPTSSAKLPLTQSATHSALTHKLDKVKAKSQAKEKVSSGSTKRERKPTEAERISLKKKPTTKATSTRAS